MVGNLSHVRIVTLLWVRRFLLHVDKRFGVVRIVGRTNAVNIVEMGSSEMRGTN